MLERLFCLLGLETLNSIRDKDLSFFNTKKEMNKIDQNAIDSSALELNRMEKTVETILRIASMALSLAGLMIMIKNSVSNDFGSLSYSNLGAFMCTFFSLCLFFFLFLFH